jgi:hypothetical protein
MLLKNLPESEVGAAEKLMDHLEIVLDRAKATRRMGDELVPAFYKIRNNIIRKRLDNFPDCWPMSGCCSSRAVALVYDGFILAVPNKEMGSIPEHIGEDKRSSEAIFLTLYTPGRVFFRYVTYQNHKGKCAFKDKGWVVTHPDHDSGRLLGNPFWTSK